MLSTDEIAQYHKNGFVIVSDLFDVEASVVDDLHARVTEGDSLAEAMARHPRAFKELDRSIVRAGGEGGFLEEALERVAKFTDQEAELKSRVLGAMAYPIFLATFGVTIVTVLVIGTMDSLSLIKVLDTKSVTSLTVISAAFS